MWNMHVLFVPLQVFPRYSSTLIWRGAENGGACTSSLQLRARQPDLILLHFSSGFSPLLSAPSIHLWAPTLNKPVQTHVQWDKVICMPSLDYYQTEFVWRFLKKKIKKKDSVWQPNLFKSYDTNPFWQCLEVFFLNCIFPIFFQIFMYMK